MKIGDFEIGKGTFIIAELSANHGHDIHIAKASMKAAKEVGADAIKVQTYTADTLTIDCSNPYFTINSGTIWDGRTLYDLYKEASMPWEWQGELMEYAKELGILFFSTPYDKTAVDFLEELKVPAYKVASFEITDLPLITYLAAKGKPILLSTGIASLGELEEALSACRRVGNDQVVLLKCTSAYPAKIEDANLKTIAHMKEAFGVEVGLSDHTLGITVPVLSIAFGAKVIEKHFILDRSMGGPDASFSLEPQEFRQMVDAIREAEKAIGTVDYRMTEKKKSSRLFSRSLFVVEDMKAGELLTDRNVRSIRPAYGLKPKYITEVLGKKARRDIKKGTPVSWDIIE